MRILCLVSLVCASFFCRAQDIVPIIVTDAKSGKPLEFVVIAVDRKYAGTTDSSGTYVARPTAGKHEFSFNLTGYAAKDTVIELSGLKKLAINLNEDASLEEVVVVASTRNNRRIENNPTKVEVLGLEEMNEEAGVRPANIASILGDVSGIQIQQSSAISGNSNVRIQGLGGRYTQILRDGMPLYDGFAGGFGILTVPPLDLKQIELIKGSASTLYGAGAISGLINLISKRPLAKQELDILANYTTLKEVNANVYAAKRYGKFGYNLFAGYTHQQAVDVNTDGLSDLPRTSSFVIHPRIFYYPGPKTTIYVGYNGAFDNRKGGDMSVLEQQPDSIHRFYESNISQRHTGEFLAERRFLNNSRMTVKGNLSSFSKQTRTNLNHDEGRQLSYFGEASALFPFNAHDVIVGVNVVGNNYHTISPDSASLKHFDNSAVGVFAQLDLTIKEHTSVEAGLRYDQQKQYGGFLLPRVAVFHQFNAHWGSRLGFGMGYKTPSPLVQQNLDYSILDMLPPDSHVKPEISYGYNAELNFRTDMGTHTSLFINQAFFLTQIENPILFDANAAGKIFLQNAERPTVSRGFDTYVKLETKTWEFYLGYTYTDARYKYRSGNDFIPLTPKNRLAFVVVKSVSKQLSAGVEASYFGRQYRYDGTQTPDYVFLAAMARYQIGRRITLVLNGENLLDYRMSRVEPLYTGSISNPSFKPLWAPIDGRVINLSVRWKLNP